MNISVNCEQYCHLTIQSLPVPFNRIYKNLHKITSLVFVQPGAKFDSSCYCDVVLVQQDGAQAHPDKELHFCIFMCQNLWSQKIGRRIAQT